MPESIVQRLRTLGIAAAGLVAVFVLGACSGGDGEDRPGGVEVIGGEGSVSVSGAVEGYGEPLYFPSTNQDLNLAIGSDLRDMRSLMSAAVRGEAVDWAAVTVIYERGKNQRQPDGAVRTLASLATGSLADTVIRAGLAGTGRGAGLSDNARRQMVDKGVQVLMYSLATERLVTAETRFKAGSTDAAVALDEAWAVLSGSRDETTLSPNSGLLATGLAREEDFRLQGRLSRPLESSLFAALAAVGRKDSGAFDRELAASRGYLNSIMYLSVLRYAKVLEADQRASDREFHLAEGWAFFQPFKALAISGSSAAGNGAESAYSSSAAAEFTPAQTMTIYAAMNHPVVTRALGIPTEFQFTAPPQ